MSDLGAFFGSQEWRAYKRMVAIGLGWMAFVVATYVFFAGAAPTVESTRTAAAQTSAQAASGIAGIQARAAMAQHSVNELNAANAQAQKLSNHAFRCLGGKEHC